MERGDFITWRKHSRWVLRNFLVGFWFCFLDDNTIICYKTSCILKSFSIQNSGNIITFKSAQRNFYLASFIFTILYTKDTYKSPILFQLLKLHGEFLRLSHLFYLWKDFAASLSKKKKKSQTNPPKRVKMAGKQQYDFLPVLTTGSHYPMNKPIWSPTPAASRKLK